MPHPDAPGLADLVADPEEFVADVLFRRVLWSPGAAAARERHVIAEPDRLWDDALTRGLRTPFFRLVRDGATLPVAGYCRSAGVGHGTIVDVIQPNRVVELHRCGATMVLQGLQFTDAHLGRLANNLALAIDQPIQVNAYLSPAAARGLELHFDYHDVFVVQIGGRKRWRVWEPLARTHDPVRGGSPIAAPTLDELGTPSLDLTLEPGDCLYLPRGYPHAAETVDDASAHLTIGVMALTWQRAIRHATDAATGAAGLRASLPSRALGRGAPLVPPDLTAIADHLDAASLRPWLAREIWRRQPATRLAPLTAPVLDIATPAGVRVTPGPLLWLVPAGPRVHLGLGDRHLDLPVEAHDFVAALMAAPARFHPAAWPGELDRSSRQVVVDRLAAEGAIVAG